LIFSVVDSAIRGHGPNGQATYHFLHLFYLITQQVPLGFKIIYPLLLPLV
jgi:hypothetical protein